MLKIRRLPEHSVRLVILALICALLATLVTPAQAKIGLGFRGVAWSPDGEQIAFSYYDLTRKDGMYNRLFVMDVEGKHLTELAAGEVESIAWSPEGTRLAFSRTETKGITMIDLAQPDVRTMISSEGRFPVWSLDGEAIHYADPANNLFSLNLKSEQAQQFATAGKQYKTMWSATWSPDRQALAFVTPRTPSQYDLIVLDAKGQHWLEEGSDVGGPLSWSPDGKYIAANAQCGGRDYVLCVYNVATGERQQLSEGWLPVWSPDGTQIALIQGSQICLINADGSDQRCLLEAEENVMAQAYAWSPDGRYLLFSRNALPTQDFSTIFDTFILDMQTLTITPWFDATMIDPA